MAIKLEPPKITELKPRITVIGVGGAGCNAVGNMIGTGLEGVEFIVANTDSQALAMSTAERRIQLGANLTEGLGAGAQPDIGQAAAEEAREEIRAQLEGSHMVFLAAGMGGGTGTGAVPVIARIAREMNILTVAIVTKPFHFEGSRRMRVAEAGIAELKPVVDTLIVIPNQNLFRIANDKTTFAEAFVLADQVLYSGIACIVDLIVKDGLINLDFADVKVIMRGMGSAMMGTGEASGEDRAIVAAEQAIANPLLDEMTLGGARGLLISIVGGRDMSLYDVDAAASRVKQDASPDANIIVGASFDDTIEDRLRVSIVASGMGGEWSEELPPPLAGHAPHQRAAGTTPAPATEPPPFQPQGYAPYVPQTSGSAPADPYLGQEDPDDFARILSNVVGHVDNAAPPEAGHDGRGGWVGPDGVTIEEVSPALASARTTPPPLPGQARSRDETAGPTEFTAAPPGAVRPRVSRIPNVAEFPEVGQRDYYAKQVGDRNATGAAQGRPSGGATGLLRKLGMMGRGDSQNSPPLGPSHGVQNATPKTPQSAASRPSERPSEAQNVEKKSNSDNVTKAGQETENKKIFRAGGN
jgi:cell division protein FtsZ